MSRPGFETLVGGGGGAWGGLARAGLTVLEPFYGAAVAGRNAMFDRGWRKAHPLGRPTISIGNLTVGGTGKTPMTIELVGRLIEQGRRPAVLMRGYGEDETLELRQAFDAWVLDGRPPVEVVADPSRLRGARRLLRHRPDVDVFVLDDGFQHRQAARELDLVLVDATQPFGHERLLPRGLLREPIAQLRRAHGVIVTRADQVEAEALSALDERIERAAGVRPMAHVACRWTELRGLEGAQPVAHLAGRCVAAACGVGNPGAFFEGLRRAGASLVWQRALRDHQRYTAGTVRTLARSAMEAGAAWLVTTEKDWVKWSSLLDAEDWPLPVVRPRLGVTVLDGEDQIEDHLARVGAPSPFQGEGGG